MGVLAVANATTKVYKAVTRQCMAMSMQMWFRVRNAPSSAVIGAIAANK